MRMDSLTNCRLSLDMLSARENIGEEKELSIWRNEIMSSHKFGVFMGWDGLKLSPALLALGQPDLGQKIEYD